MFNHRYAEANSLSSTLVSSLLYSPSQRYSLPSPPYREGWSIPPPSPPPCDRDNVRETWTPPTWTGLFVALFDFAFTGDSFHLLDALPKIKQIPKCSSLRTLFALRLHYPSRSLSLSLSASLFRLWLLFSTQPPSLSFSSFFSSFLIRFSHCKGKIQGFRSPQSADTRALTNLFWISLHYVLKRVHWYLLLILFAHSPQFQQNIWHIFSPSHAWTFDYHEPFQSFGSFPVFVL